MLKSPFFKSVILLSAILLFLSLFISCEEAYQEAKDNQVSREDSPAVEDTLSPVNNEYEPINDEIPVFKNEAMNRAIEQYTAVSVRLEIATRQDISSEVKELQKKKQEILNLIQDLRPLLTQEEQLTLDKYVQSFGENVGQHQH